MTRTTSKLTSKYQATIPKPVRHLLNLNAGDVIAFDIENNHIHLRKASTIDLEFAHSLENTLTEWSSTEDEKAYRDL